MSYTADIDRMRRILREEDIPFFSDEDLVFYVNENNGDENAAIYQCLLIKAENTSLGLSGVNLPDSSSYFRKLAQRYRPNNSGVLKGG